VRFKQTTLVDLSNPAARDWMAASMSAALALGMDGWMADYAEWLPADARLASGSDAEREHNLYPVEWQKLNERVLKANPEALSFVRSGYTQSTAITQQIVWGGDQTTDFDIGDGIPTVIPIGIGLGVAGLPYYGSDIAGYFSGSGHPFVTEELFYRWTTLGALSPIMRTHHGVASGKNWNLEKDAASLDHYRRWARVHTQLYPYLLDASQKPEPLFRALALDFPKDPAAWGIKDQFMLGASILVAPVLTAGATSRKVYFPSGKWLPLFAAQNSAPISGPISTDVNAPTTEIPAFARAGAVLVLLAPTIETLARSTNGVPDLDTANQSREILALLGASGSAPDYTLTSSAEPDDFASLAWNGAPLSPCAATPVLPCGSVSVANREATALTSGVGTLTFGGSQLLVSSSRNHALHLRW
jgi:alpha-glucosidase